MIIGTVLLAGLFVFPLWTIMLGAPQYPDPLGMKIHINKLEGDEPFEHLGESLALPPFLEPQRSEIEARLKPLD